MAESMLRIGMTSATIDTSRLARDIAKVFSRVDTLSGSDTVPGQHEDRDVQELLMDILAIGRDHGIKFPREFALLVKQFLYFDRYVHILAPEMDIFMDDGLVMLPDVGGHTTE